MPYQESPSPAKRPVMDERSVSTPQASPGTLPSPSHRSSKSHKPHTATQGRIPHARNLSHGKNLNKLTKVKAQSPSTSPTGTHVKRNSSHVSLPRANSKTSIKRNTSNISLKRNGSAAQLTKTARPTTHLRRSESSSKNVPKVKSATKGTFSVGSDDDQDEDWTEESNSQSPSTTRRSSVAQAQAQRTLPSRETPPDDEPITHTQANLPASPPESPSTDDSSFHSSPTHPPPQPYNPLYITNPPAAPAVTSRLLTRRSTQNLAPQMTPLSATGTPGTSTPPHLLDPSMPDNGISRFLSTAHSSSTPSTTPSPLTHLHSAAKVARPRSPSPAALENNVRRAKSAFDLSHSTPDPQISLPAPNTREPPSYVFDPAMHRRPGGNTQAKLELWRTQVNIEPSQGPPVALHNRRAGVGEGLASSERRARQWERAEGEMGYLRRFRNPVVESLGRFEKGAGAKKREGGGGAARGKDGAARPVSRRGEGLGNGRVRFEAGPSAVESRRSVESLSGEELEELLRRMWEGGEAEMILDG